jgi:hypothetical protein
MDAPVLRITRPRHETIGLHPVEVMREGRTLDTDLSRDRSLRTVLARHGEEHEPRRQRTATLGQVCVERPAQHPGGASERHTDRFFLRFRIHT